MRLIKKHNQTNIPFQALTFSQNPESYAAAPAIPSWVEADARARWENQQASFDVARIEKSAYETGFHEGEKSGQEIAEKKVEAMMKRYADTVLEIGKLKPALYAQVEKEVVRLALEVAKKIVHREVHVDGEIVQTLIRVALSHVAIKSAVTVHLNPADYNYVHEQRAASARPGDVNPEIVWLADKSIGRGGCLIETECGDVDARIEEEFREVERAFFSSEE